jgi:hypothetical protein
MKDEMVLSFPLDFAEGTAITLTLLVSKKAISITQVLQFCLLS